LVLATASPAASVERLETRACPEALAGSSTLEAACYVFHVAEDPQDPNSIVLKIPVMQLGAKGARSKPDPVFMLNGGPGSAQYERHQARVLAFTPQQARAYFGGREWVIFDQRGVGASQPRLLCEDDATLEAVRACAVALQVQGVKLNKYSSTTIAGDVERLRKAMGYDRINLWGRSYGSRLAHTMARLYPRSVRAIIHDGPMRPDSDESIDDAIGAEAGYKAVADDFQASSLGAMDPDLWTRFNAGLSKLARSPQRIDGELIDDAAAIRLMNRIGYTDEVNRPELLPAAMLAVATGNLEPMIADSKRRGSPRPPPEMRSANGMWRSVDCNEEKVFESPGQIEQVIRTGSPVVAAYLRDLMLSKPFEKCAAWPSGRADSIETQPVSSPIPQLVFTGQYDPTLSGLAGEGVVRISPTARNVVFKRLGHVQVTKPWHACAYDLANRFFDAPQGPLDTSCASAYPPLSFQLSFPTPAR
jgi:pimeloyl-ACP methyl ester carboxylesterase